MNTPTVTLAGKEYPVPDLVPLQQRELFPALKRAIDYIVKHKGESFSSMNREFIDDGLTIVYWGAIWPNEEKTTFDQFLRMKVSSIEIMKAVPIIQIATGLFEKTKPQEGGTPGESEKSPPETEKK